MERKKEGTYAKRESVIRCKYKNNYTRLSQCLYLQPEIRCKCVIILKRHEGNKTKINNTRIIIYNERNTRNNTGDAGSIKYIGSI